MGTRGGPWGQWGHGVNEDIESTRTWGQRGHGDNEDMGTTRTHGGHQGQQDVGGHGVSMEKVRT